MPSPRFLVVLDADSTLIRNEVIELIADEAGRGPEVAAATEAAMRGEVDFATSLRSRVRALEGVPLEAFARVLSRIEPTPGVRELIAAVHERGGRVGVVSGGFHEILDVVAPGLGVDVWRANRLATSDGVLTGHVDGGIVDAEAKAASLLEWAASRRRAGILDDRDRRRGERPADDGCGRPRSRVQRQACRARAGRSRDRGGGPPRGHPPAPLTCVGARD